LTHPNGIDEIADDPDILVVGFQELDLSTGALLYSTETLREDAWTSAVFAGLGEKIELYDKVSHDESFFSERTKCYPSSRGLVVCFEATGRNAHHGLHQEDPEGVF